MPERNIVHIVHHWSSEPRRAVASLSNDTRRGLLWCERTDIVVALTIAHPSASPVDIGPPRRLDGGRAVRRLTVSEHCDRHGHARLGRHEALSASRTTPFQVWFATVRARTCSRRCRAPPRRRERYGSIGTALPAGPLGRPLRPTAGQRLQHATSRAGEDWASSRSRDAAPRATCPSSQP